MAATGRRAALPALPGGRSLTMCWQRCAARWLTREGRPAVTGWSWDGGYPMADLGPADAELADVMAEIAGSDYGAELASLAHVSGLIGLSAATEQQRLAEDAEDQLARRPTSEDQLARAIGRISRGTYSHALARDPLGQFATHG